MADVSKTVYVITVRRYAGAVLAIVMCLSVCLSIRPSIYLSVTQQYCVKMAKRRIMETILHDSPGTLVFWC